MNPFLEFLQTSLSQAGRGARAANAVVSPWQYFSPTDVAAFAPGGGIVQGNQDILAAKDAWTEGNYPKAVGLGAQSLLNTGLDVLPMTSALPAISLFGGKAKPTLMDDWATKLMSEMDAVDTELKVATEALGPAPQSVSNILNDDALWNKAAGPDYAALEKQFQGLIDDPNWKMDAPHVPSAAEKEAQADWDLQHGDETWGSVSDDDFYNSTQLAAADQYTDALEAGFGSVDKAKEYYKTFTEKQFSLAPEELELVNAMWPEMKTDYMTPKPIAPTDWGVPGSKKSQRMIYQDELVGPPVPSRDLPPETRDARIREHGMDPNEVLFSGVPQWGDVWPVAWKDPQVSAKDERAIFLSDQEKIASDYAGSRGTVLPVHARMENPLELDWEKTVGTKAYSSADMQELIDSAIDAGHDSMILRGMLDIGSSKPQDQYLVFNPNQLRSIFARFDPKNIHANDLTAAMAAALGLGTVAKELETK